MKRRRFLKTLASSALATIPFKLVAETAQQPLHADPATGPRGFTKETYTATQRVRSGMALGGIGAGTLELRKNGRFYNWNIFNNFPKETGPAFRLPEGEVEDPEEANLFFLVRFQVAGEEPKIKLLQLSDSLYEGGEMGIAFDFPWMQAVDKIEYSARFPFSTLRFSAEDMPFVVQLQAWTPFIPHAVKESSLPLAYFDFTIESESDRLIDVTLIMTAQNNVGYDTPERFYITEIGSDNRSKIVSMSVGGMSEKASTWGQIALASFSPASTHYCGWGHRHPYLEYVLRNAELPNLDDTRGVDGIVGKVPNWLPVTKGRNRIDPATGKLQISDQILRCSVARSFRLNGRGNVSHTFAYTWNFPNLYAEQSFRHMGDTLEGHYYSNFFQTATDVANYALSEREELHRRSKRFLDNFFDSSAETFVLDQVNSQLNTFVTNGRLVKNGEFGILEGLSSTWSWGPIGTIDVMLYGTVPVIALFPELQKSTMRCHQRSQSAEGEIAHGLHKGFHAPEDGTAGVSHRLDLPGQYISLVLRDFFWTNDLGYLREMYPSIQRAIDYMAQHRSFPHTSIPLMKGIESSYDNFPMYGYAAYVLSQWMCAISCAIRAADTLQDASSGVRYRQMLAETRAAMEQNLWNGRYYSLYNDSSEAAGHGDRSEGCLTDQLIGQWFAHQVGIGYLLEENNVRSALREVLGKSYQSSFGLRNCTWPGTTYFADVDKNIWVDQGNTCWSGVELAFASFLLYEGMYTEAMNVIHTVDIRYRKNGLYFDHQEFGGHYFRPMAAWAILNGMLGLAIDRDRILFCPQMPSDSYKLFFATPTGTAHFIKRADEVRIHVLSGTLLFTSLSIAGSFRGEARLDNKKIKSTSSQISEGSRRANEWRFSRPIQLFEGNQLQLL